MDTSFEDLTDVEQPTKWKFSGIFSLNNVQQADGGI